MTNLILGFVLGAFFGMFIALLLVLGGRHDE